MHQIPKLKCFSSRLAVVFAQYIEAKCSVENEDVVGAAPTGDAPTTSEWSTISLPTQVRLILETWRYITETNATKFYHWPFSQFGSLYVICERPACRKHHIISLNQDSGGANDIDDPSKIIPRLKSFKVLFSHNICFHWKILLICLTKNYG